MNAEDIRRALGDPIMWQIITADEDDRLAVVDWLTTSVMQVRADRKIRKAQSVAERAKYIQGTRQWHQCVAGFSDWDSRARRFERMCVLRLQELGFNEQGHPLRASRSSEVDRLRAHAELMERKNGIVILLMADLASMVEAFIEGRATREELDQTLDDLMLTNGDGGDGISLRNYLAARRRKVAAA